MTRDVLKSYRIQQGIRIFILLRYLLEIWRTYQIYLDQVEQEGIGDDRETGIDDIIRVDRDENITMVPYYFLKNGIGSITAVTDDSGDVVERVSYDTYGMPTITDASGTVLPNSSMGNDFLFHGRRYDKETNLYYYRARYLDPIMGRFLQTDPLGYRDSMNLYQSFNQNPVNYLDPFGKYSIDFHYYTIYYLMRSKGWEHEKADKVASFSQYVDDDSITDWIAWDLSKVNFFHFPGANDTGGAVTNWHHTRRWLQSAAQEYSKKQNIENSALFGALLHPFADSWAHEGFNAYEGGHIHLSDTPDMIPISKTHIETAIDAAKNVFNIMPEGEGSVLNWDEVEKDLRYVFSIYNKPQEKEKLAILMGDFFGTPVFWVKRGIQHLSKKRFGVIPRYTEEEIKKCREEFIKVLSKFNQF